MPFSNRKPAPALMALNKKKYIYKKKKTFKWENDINVYNLNCII